MLVHQFAEYAFKEQTSKLPAAPRADLPSA